MDAKEDLTQFINANISNESKEKYYLNHMEVCLKSLSKIDEDMTNIINKINKIIAKAINSFPDKFDRFRYSNEVYFISNKYFNLFMKYQALRFKNYNQIKQIAEKFKNMISGYLSQNIPVQVNYSDFVNYLSCKNDKAILKMQFKLCSLFNYVKNLKNFEKNRKFSTNELLFVIQKLSSKIDIQNDYIQPNYFDLIFESYVESNKELYNAFLQIINIGDYDFTYQKFQNGNTKTKNNKPNDDYSNINKSLIFNNFDYYLNMLDSKKSPKLVKKADKKTKKNIFENTTPTDDTNQKKKEFDFILFNTFIQKVYIYITKSNQIDRKIFIILYCACVRFLSNKYYIAHENKWFEKVDDGYVQSCIQIIDQTPRELNISNDLIPAKFNNTKFREILLNEDYEKAVKIMFSIQFFSCPIEIWYGMKVAVDLSLKCVNKLNDDKNSKPNISFDDFFSIVLPVFAAAQINCPTALNSMLVNFKPLSKASSLDSTALLAIALSGFIYK